MTAIAVFTPDPADPSYAGQWPSVLERLSQALAREVPKGLEPQVYMMSLLAIDFDHEEEARYLRELAQALGLQQDAVNDVHEQVGVQNLN